MLRHHPAPDGGLIELEGNFTLCVKEIVGAHISAERRMEEGAKAVETGEYACVIRVTGVAHFTALTRDRAEVEADLRTVTEAMKAYRQPQSPTYGPWTTLGELRPGAIFETESGWRALRMADGNNATLREGLYQNLAGAEQTRVREVILPEPRR